MPPPAPHIRSVFTAAGRTVALYLERVLHSPEAGLSAEIFLDRLELRRENLEHRTAVEADQMVVMAVAEDVFVMGVLVVPADLLDETAFEEQGKGPVYGGPRDPDILLPHAGEEFFGIEVAVAGEDLSEDRPSLIRELEALLAEKLLEYRGLHKVILNNTALCFNSPQSPSFSATALTARTTARETCFKALYMR